MAPHPPIPVFLLDQTDSTNAVARGRLEDGTHSDGPAWIVANAQTAGKGREGRAWLSPPGGLWATLLWPLSLSPPATTYGLGLRIGVALTETIASTGIGSRARLKWPNDVLVDGKKIAGVLTELVALRGKHWAIVGCGINIQNRSTDLPAELQHTATSLIECGVATTPEAILSDLSPRLRWALMTDGLDDETLTRARHLLYGVGEPTRIRQRNGTQTIATLIGLDDTGRALYRCDDGSDCIAEPIVGS